jgi:hypothetical protein
MREILDVGLAGRVPQYRCALRGRCGDQGVLGRGDAGFVEEDIRSTKAVHPHLDQLTVGERGAELFERKEMGVQPAPADDISARRRKRHLPAAREQRSRQEDGCTDLGAENRIEIGRTQICGVNR